MPISDAIVVGQPKLDSAFFGNGYEVDFKNASLKGLIDDNPEASSRGGKINRGFYMCNAGLTGATWGRGLRGPAQINKEQQMYPDELFRHKYNYSGLRTGPHGLTMTSRHKNGGYEDDFTRVKGYEVNPDGSSGAFLQDLKVDYLGEMISSYGLHSQSFGEWEATLRMPYGAVPHPNDATQRRTAFPAWWLLQDIPWGRDIAGNRFVPHDPQHLFMPAKFGLGGVMTELDIAEGFGYERNAIHSTMHHHEEGVVGTQSDPRTVPVDFDIFLDWFVAGIHVTVEKIGVYINGVYTSVWDTPPEIGLGMRIPTFDPATPYIATGFSSLYQNHDNVSDRRYMQFCWLLNVARDGGITRDLAQLTYNDGYEMPHHSETTQMFVEKLHAKPLIVENPDAYGMTVRGEYVPTINDGWEALAA